MTDKQQQQDTFTADMMQVMDTPFGRRFVWAMLERTRVFQLSFTGNSQTFFNEGMRNVGLELLSDLQTKCPQQYLTMQRENMRLNQET